MIEAHRERLKEPHGRGKVLVVLAGESNDEVNPKTEVGMQLRDTLDQSAVVVGGVGPPHLPQDAVAPRLEG